MSNHGQSPVLHSSICAWRCCRSINGQGGSLTASIQRGANADVGVPITANGHCGSFDPETTVTFVRKEAECALNDAGFIDNMSTE